MKTFVLLLSFVAITAFSAEDPAEILLWPNGAPGSEGKTDPETVKTSGGGERQVSTVHKPSITPFLPDKDKANGCAVLVIPGGGHTVLCVDHEGTFIAKYFVDHGIAAFVLKHRLAREKGSTYTIEGHAVPDAQRAMRLIRSRAAEWNIDPNRLGAIGFSAGGELVNASSLLPGEGKADATDPIDKLNSRPSFQGLIYPGLSVNIKPEKDSPPAFLACSINDRQDIAEGLAEAYLRFKRAGASAELHIYATGNHGFGYRPTSKGAVAGWADRFVEWLASKNFLAAGKK